MEANKAIPHFLFLFLFFFLLILSLPCLSSTLDPNEVSALKSMNIPTSKDPCTNPSLLCDDSKPFRHVISVNLSNCSPSLSLSLKPLSSLKSLSFLHCPIHIPPTRRLPQQLLSFSSVDSLRRLTGVWLSNLRNLTHLTVSSVPISASGPTIILSNLIHLQSATISSTNLTGSLPKSWRQNNLTHLDLSDNRLKGQIHPSISTLDTLTYLNLSSNQLSGQIPVSLSSLSSLVYLDLSSNQLNGTIPASIADIKHLKYLNLDGNNFQGVLPFNRSFIKGLVLFKIGENTNLCYNTSTVSSNPNLGISPCDQNGLPMSPPSKSDSSSSSTDSSSDGGDSSSSDSTTQKSSPNHAPNKVVLGIAIAFASIIFLIIFLIFLAKRCS